MNGTNTLKDEWIFIYLYNKFKKPVIL